LIVAQTNPCASSHATFKKCAEAIFKPSAQSAVSEQVEVKELPPTNKVAAVQSKKVKATKVLPPKVAAKTSKKSKKN
jgi:hypothetical protein